METFKKYTITETATKQEASLYLKKSENKDRNCTDYKLDLFCSQHDNTWKPLILHIGFFNTFPSIYSDDKLKTWVVESLPRGYEIKELD